jgi:hypothetical protein
VKLNNDIFALTVLRARKALGKTKLDMTKDVLPYLAEHKNELQNDIEEMHQFRSSLVKTELRNKIAELQAIVDNL